MNTIMRQNDVCYVRKCNPVVLSPVSLACVCRASSGVTHRYTQPAYTTGALRLSGLHTVTHWSEWLQTLDPQYWTKIRILPTVSVDFALNFTFRLVPHALPQCTALPACQSARLGFIRNVNLPCRHHLSLSLCPTFSGEIGEADLQGESEFSVEL